MSGRPRSKGRVAAALGVGLAVAATVWLLTWPCYYRGVTATPAAPGAPSEPVRHLCASLLAFNGARVIWLLMVPVGLSVLGLIGVRFGLRWLAWTGAILASCFCVIGVFSVGLFYVPSAAALFVASIRSGPAREGTGSQAAIVGGRGGR